MVDWNSATEIAKDALAFDRFMHALLGVYIWEWIVSLHFDWQYITRRKQFRWPMIFYFLNRYSLLIAMIGIIISLDIKTEINCQSLYTFNSVFGNAASGLASINLSIRTMAVWSRRWYIVVPLIIIILGHWSLLLHGVVVRAVWVPGTGCVVTSTNATMLAATWIYTMVFDFIVMSLTAIKLLQPSAGNRSRLVELIFADGLIYFMFAFLSNLVATVFMLLNLNVIMSIIGNVPAVLISTIVACRVVRRLSNFTSRNGYLFSTTAHATSSLAFRSKPPQIFSRATQQGVHVQMETFRAPETEAKATFMDFDDTPVITQKDNYDIEAQAPHGVEFKVPTPPS